MSSPAPFASIGELLQRSLSIRHVYGEPVQHGETTVIPVAQVAFGFGGGGGAGPIRPRIPAAGDDTVLSAEPARLREAQGAGGGGGVRMTPVGAFVIDRAGVRFVRCRRLTPWVAAAAVGLVACAAVAWRRFSP